MKKFENKTVIVTGGGSGIGKATAKAFLEEGAQVVITGRRQEVLESTAKELGGAIHYVAGDVGKKGDARKIVSETVDRFGGLDIVVNNAGVFTMGPLSEVSDEEIERVYRTNVFGTYAVIREALPHLVQSKGNVVNISSTVTKGVMPGSALYSSSKAAIDHSTRCLAAELGPQGVRVNAVAPGLTITDMSAGIRNDQTSSDAIVAQTPMGRHGQPHEIADTVLLLAGNKAGWVTGQVVQASGGLML